MFETTVQIPVTKGLSIQRTVSGKNCSDPNKVNVVFVIVFLLNKQ